jgi:hypothetical protein
MYAASRARLAIVGVLAVAGFGAPAVQAQTTTVLPVAVFCTTTIQLCSPAFTTPVTTNGLLQVAVTMGVAGCSSVIAHLLVDGVELAVTPPIAPGVTSTTYTLSPVSPGTHTLGVQGEGVIGGCNTGYLAAWGGTVQVTTDGTAAVTAPIPAPGLIATALAFLLGALAFFWHRRARG